MNKDLFITAMRGGIVLYTLMLLAIGFAAGYRKAKVDAAPLVDIEALHAEMDRLQHKSDSLVVAIEASQEEAFFWQLQVHVTNELLAQSQLAIDSFNRLTPQRNAQRNKMAVAGAAELDSFFATRYQPR